jgi:hypothetical protein
MLQVRFVGAGPWTVLSSTNYRPCPKQNSTFKQEMGKFSKIILQTYFTDSPV